MEPGEKIAKARKKKGLTQQELADLTNLTTRTIQRIENGQSIPRAFTITAIAEALGTTFQELQAEVQDNEVTSVKNTIEKEKHFLKLLTLSCFSYLLIPIVHALVPIYILKKSGIHDEVTLNVARKTIRTQIIWTVAINGIMLACLAFNFISAIYFGKIVIINFLLPFFIMYAINAVILMKNFVTINRHFR